MNRSAIGRPVAGGLGVPVGLEPALHHLLELVAGERRHQVSSSTIVRAWVGQYFTAASTASRWSSGGRLVEHGELAVLRHREDVGRLGLADPVPLAQVAVDDDPPAHQLERAPAPVAGGAGLGELHDHLRVVVAVGVGRLGELERYQRQQHREDRLELHHGEGGAHAAVAAGAEGDPAPRVGDVVLAGLEVAGRGRTPRRRRRPAGRGSTPTGWPPPSSPAGSCSRRPPPAPWPRAAGG